MYIDSIVVYSLVVVFFVCAISVYVGIYAYKKVQEDGENAEQERKSGAY